MTKHRLGISGRITQLFQTARITPLLALIALLLGLFAVMVTPREEEPQINVTMANVLIPFPGASVADVEKMVAQPAEQVLAQLAGLDHVMSVSRLGLAVITVQFKVGVPQTEALVDLYNTLQSNRDWLPRDLGVLEPIVKPKGIDDVPIVTLTLSSQREDGGAYDLERVAHSIEADIKRVSGTREVVTIGGPGHVINVDIDPGRMQATGVTVQEIKRTLASANIGVPVGNLVTDNRTVDIEAGSFLQNTRDLAQLMVAVHNGRPVFLSDVAVLRDGPPPAQHYVWRGNGGARPQEAPAVTLSITKKPGQNAVDVADQVIGRVNTLRNTVIPADVRVEVSRNYGQTANEKALKLIEKLLLATALVVALVFIALGRREAAIVGTAVVLTLAATLFASWAWGFTLNRVSLFALIFSIGILVDDAIVVVENIHRHRLLKPGLPLMDIIPAAVDEVGGPTILATLTVIAALLPMAFVSGLMGPYMSPIPINASMGMLISLAVAFVVTPWLANLWLSKVHHGTSLLSSRLMKISERIFRPFLDDTRGKCNRMLLGLAVGGAILISVSLPFFQLVVLKMLPFDNKSEFQVVVDMPAGTPLERTAAALHEMTGSLAGVPEIKNYQAYAGIAAPINFNGLVRQYYLRAGGEIGDIQVNLVDKSQRSDKSHIIATRVRQALAKIGARYGARVKVVEVPPGPPVMAPLVAEVYGPDETGRAAVADNLRKVFLKTPGVVDVDSSIQDTAAKQTLIIDRRKAGLLGVPQQAIVDSLRAGFSGDDVTYLHDASKYPVATRVALPARSEGDLQTLLSLPVRGGQEQLIPIRELVMVEDGVREQPVYHKDLLPVVYVTGDMAGRIDSPLYGMFAMRGALEEIPTPSGRLGEYFIHQPDDPYRQFAVKWDGEWRVTYETFRDMGAAYAVGLILIYLLIVAQFGSYLTPLIIMAPIPLTVIGVMPGHALLGAQYTATSMIGMIALAGIIVRNSILLVDFIVIQVHDGVPFKQAVIHSAAMRAQPIALTALAAMLGALFILDDPIFNGLAISLIFGIMVSTVLTLLVIPLLYYVAWRHRHPG